MNMRKMYSEESTKRNLHCLKDVSKNIEKSISILDLVSTLGNADLYDDRDELTNKLQSLNCVAREITQAIRRLEQ